MTAPRRVLPAATLMLSRRCLNRMLLLRPSKLTNQLFSFILAVVAERYGIEVHCFCVLSNHFHLVATDPLGTSPAFMRDLCALVARSFNALHGRWENLWAPGSYSAVALLTPDDVLDKMAYVLANPAAADLVQHGSEWPGLWSAPAQIGGAPIRIDRPRHFFREEGPMPGYARLQLSCPCGFDSAEDFRAELERRVAALEDEAARKRKEKGGTVLGAKKVLAQKPHARPAFGEPRRGLNPRIAARDKWKRIEAIGRLKEFLHSYRAAWAAFTRGARDALFPHGTYWMRIAYGAVCAAPG
jgi:putative transposase